jgi:hypothetical protein
MTDQLDTEPVDAPAASNGKPTDAQLAAEGWAKDKRGRWYVPKPAGGGAVFRRDEETVEQALQRDAEPKRDQRPRRKPKSKRPGPMPDAPTGVDLKQLEALLAEALSAPAMPCAMFGDKWAADHFTTQAPYLARNLVLASEHNPWLRRKLEGMATGQDAAAKALAMLGVTGALFAYAIPPIIWWFNPPVPDQARAMFGVPAREPKPTPPPAPYAQASEAAPPAAVT